MKVRILRTELKNELILPMVSEHRHVNCSRYDKCLNKVIKKRWKSFSCSRCPVFRKYIRKKVNRRYFDE